MPVVLLRVEAVLTVVEVVTDFAAEAGTGERQHVTAVTADVEVTRRHDFHLRHHSCPVALLREVHRHSLAVTTHSCNIRQSNHVLNSFRTLRPKLND